MDELERYRTRHSYGRSELGEKSLLEQLNCTKAKLNEQKILIEQLQRAVRCWHARCVELRRKYEDPNAL